MFWRIAKRNWHNQWSITNRLTTLYTLLTLSILTLFIVTVLCFGFVPWCLYDAFYKETMKESDRLFNLYAAPILAVLGLVALFFAIKAARLRIQADEQTGISFNGKEPIPWDAIEDIDTSALAKKGYLYLKYRKSSGESETVKLDEYNLDFFDELYAMIRTKLALPQQSTPQTESPPSPASGESETPPT